MQCNFGMRRRPRQHIAHHEAFAPVECLRAGIGRMCGQPQVITSRLGAAHQVAAMAHAGWQVVSDSAAVSDKVLEHAHMLMDTQEEPA